jgi:hypothetical protein
MNPSGAASQTHNIRRQVGPLCGCPQCAYAVRLPSGPGPLAEWLGRPARTIAQRRLRLRKLGLLGWPVASGNQRGMALLRDYNRDAR